MSNVQSSAASRASFVDKWGTIASLACVVHCIATPVLFSVFAVAAQIVPTEQHTHRVLAVPVCLLGLFAMRLAAGGGTYMIHGTNNPIAVGMPVTHGCIRLYPEDVAQLFPMIPVGMPVRIINQPVKVAWVDGELLLEAHPPVDAEGQSFEPDVDQFAELLRAAVGDSTVAIHWDYAREVLQKADGVLATVGLEADLSALNTDGSPEH